MLSSLAVSSRAFTAEMKQVCVMSAVFVLFWAVWKDKHGYTEQLSNRVVQYTHTHKFLISVVIIKEKKAVCF